MAYNKIGFTKGSTLKASDLNHMEEGISGIKTFDLVAYYAADDSLAIQDFSLVQEAFSALSCGQDVIFFVHLDVLGQGHLTIPSLCNALINSEEPAIMAMFFLMDSALQVMIQPNGKVSVILS